ncbi:hypothetical protein [Streptomyces botrytidirepellens]|uniref:Uncharacterized protein n=1 Tax=Streptomyces botrytidirepellens TaxID=2486417 RepID=A0A3M8XC40_9ACTN|nr:hypothetical protein [Streptomyces botrytidirepellens]RNG38033.1 hypothetical protein EEJ42_01960 [Streptomyces botrytidirepellens]
MPASETGVPLAERTGQWKKIAAADGRLHTRLLAAHLTAHRLPAPARDEEWWTRARALVPLMLADRPALETARLAEAVWEAAGREERTELDRAARNTIPLRAALRCEERNWQRYSCMTETIARTTQIRKPAIRTST